jgi:competence protein ComEC
VRIFYRGAAVISLAFLTACGTAETESNDTSSGNTEIETSTINNSEEGSQKTPASNENTTDNISKAEQEEPKEDEPENSTNEENDQHNETVEENNQSIEEINTVEEQNASEEDLNGLEVHYIDAGQADAALFTYSYEDENYNILYDSGNWNRTDVFDYLTDQGVEHLNFMIGSHPHADHIGQMDTIIENIEVEEVWMSGDETSSQTFERVIDSVINSEADYIEPRSGDTFQAGPLEIEILNPETLSGDVHEGSLAAMFTYGGTRFLFTGDAETHTESAMISRGHELKADVLQLGHHGSNTSTSEEFLEAVEPRIAVVSAGQDSQYGHPHEEVIDRVNNSGADIYGTPVHGTIIAASDGETLEITTGSTGDVAAQDNSSGNEASSSPSNNSADQNSSENNPDADTGDCVNINSASLTELQDIHQVGPARAEDIVDLRPFSNVRDLTRVSGIGEGHIAEILEEEIACVQ